MSNYDINSNPALMKLMIENAKKAMEKYLAEHPDSLIPLFEQELRKLGYGFEIPDQIKGFMPKHKETILPIAIRYYKKAKYDYDNEKNFFISLFHFKGFDEVIPMLLEDYFAKETSALTRSCIGEALRQIGSKKYIDDYLKILSKIELGDQRNSIIALLGKLKPDAAIPLLIAALDEGKNITTNAISALGQYKQSELRPYFERFLDHKNSYYRREAKTALKKLERQLEKGKNPLK